MKKTNSTTKLTLACVIFFFLVFFSATGYTAVKTYPFLSGMQECQFGYTLKARDHGARIWSTVPLYNIFLTNQTGSEVNSTVGNFDCSGSTDIQLTFSTAVTSAVVGPASLGITPAINGNTVTFTISGPGKLYVDINGDHYNNCIHVIADSIEVNPLRSGDPNIIFIPTGTFDTSVITLHSGQTLYIQGGAAVAGIIANNVSNVKILGRGFVYRAVRNAFEVKNSRGVIIDGLIDLNHGSGGNGGCGMNISQSTNVSISNTVSFSSRKWGDGYNIFCCNGVTVTKVFIRTNDDAVTFYGGGKSRSTGNCTGITLKNSTLLPDLAQSIHVGVYGDQYDTEIRDITVSNVDICDWSRTPGRPAIYFTIGDRVRAANFHFNDVRITGYMPASFKKSLIRMAIVYNGTYNYAIGRAIDSVYFTNCSYTGSNGVPASSVNGYDSTRLTTNVFFNNLKINGIAITNAAAGNFNIGPYTNNIIFSTNPLRR